MNEFAKILATLLFPITTRILKYSRGYLSPSPIKSVAQCWDVFTWYHFCQHLYLLCQTSTLVKCLFTFRNWNIIHDTSDNEIQSPIRTIQIKKKTQHHLTISFPLIFKYPHLTVTNVFNSLFDWRYCTNV